MENEDELDAVFHALSDRRRRRLLTELAAGPKPVSVLAATLGLGMSAMSKHIGTLEAAGLVLKTRRGRQIFCHLNFHVWSVVAAYVAMHAKFWSGRLDELESHLKQVEL